MTNEDFEFEKFKGKFMDKVNELRNDYDKLSDKNKMKFKEEITPVLDSGALSWLFVRNNQSR